MKQFAIKLLKSIAITIGIFAVAIIVSYAMRLHEWVGWALYGVAFILCVFYVMNGMLEKKRYYFVSYWQGGSISSAHISTYGCFIVSDIEEELNRFTAGSSYNVSIVNYIEITKEEFKAQEGGINQCLHR